jgi:hypothetical protein
MDLREIVYEDVKKCLTTGDLPRTFKSHNNSHLSDQLSHSELHDKGLGVAYFVRLSVSSFISYLVLKLYIRQLICFSYCTGAISKIRRILPPAGQECKG